MKDRKEEIIMATLELAAQKGMGSISMSMIADKVGIKKPSLYNHFSSKEEIVHEMYRFLRERAKNRENVAVVDYATLFEGKTALEILQTVVRNYDTMNHDKDMWMFYQVIYSERSIQPMAAKIMAEETEKMILATKQLFYALQVHGLLSFQNPDMSAVTFAFTIHGLMEYQTDFEFGKKETGKKKELMQEYLRWFCEENAPIQKEGLRL